MSRRSKPCVVGFVLLLCVPAFSQECDLELTLWFQPARVVLGSPVQAMFSLGNRGNEPVLIPSENQIPSFLLMSAVDHPEVSFLRKPAGALKVHDLPVGGRVDGRLKSVYGPFVCEAGEYEIIARFPNELLHELGISHCSLQASARIVVMDPVGVDKAAFEAALEAASPSRLVCTESTIHALFRTDDQFLERFPTAVYAGYVLAEEISPLPGVGEDPADKIRQLTDPGFFQRFPTTRDRRKDAAEAARLDMEEEVRRAAKLRREFLDLHPDFPLRTKIEKQLGDLELVLGNYERAHTAWKWVADHAAQNIGWAKGMVQVMEAQKLVVVPDE